ncbi:hypothetical protein [Streptomyces sp. H39-S7]|uniref:hypothetical protein n=1 Tax=Streptomyces sp. H39-S7 TaxID=3004357 RepID=UPI0022AEC6F1|nr:hypothetical protein [Streptomyces sp. H39-S7]MCZ4120820.1 hypothetical protein [Streptomyces sp. H39-S7]
MARIRTIKPEMFISESLASVSLTAERTFAGLLTQVDDHGRFRDNAAVITGLLWPLRAEHTPVHVEEDLVQLDGAGLICRYAGGAGKRYLHLVTWHKHQKINRPSGTRAPACPTHDGAPFSEPSLSPQGGITEGSPGPHRNLGEPSREIREPSLNQEAAGQPAFSEGSVSPQGGIAEEAVSPQCPDLGPRILDLGSFLTGGASAPAPDTVSAQQLIAEYVAGCAARPPGKVLGHLGREINQLLAEGIDPAHIRTSLDRFRAKPMHPGVLPSLVNEVMNATQPGGSPHRAWTNPADAAAAYGGEL